MRKNKWLLRTLVVMMSGVLCACGTITDTNLSQNGTENTEQNSTVSSSSGSETEGNETETGGVAVSDRVIVDPSDIIMADTYRFDKLEFEDVTYQDFHVVLEAEQASGVNGVQLESALKGYTGEGYASISDNKAFHLTVDIPASQYYKVTVRHSAGSHKENALIINGQNIVNVVSEQGDWVETVVDGVYIEEGTIHITFGDGWSWFYLDSITIENGQCYDGKAYEEVTTTLSNPYANLKTQNIYQYLLAIYGKRTLTGQCTDYGHNTETDALYLGLGKYPALRTFDFIYDSLSYCKNNPTARDMKLAIEWSKDGGLVVFDWHWYAPTNECAFYSSDTSFTLSNAVTDIDVAHMDLGDLQKLYREEKITKETLMIVADIDNISKMMKRMEEEGVTVMWRPLHEASGGWFWWGSSGVDAYQWLWKLLYERMTDFHELDNLIWIWNAQNPDWYPGDEYCDIAAIDIYGPSYDYSSHVSTMEELAAWADNKKMVALSECAVMPDPDNLMRDNAYWLWFAVWNWDFIVKNGTTELSDAYTGLDMMKKVYNSELMITRDELPNFDGTDPGEGAGSENEETIPMQIKVEELRISNGENTIYGKLYRPTAEGKYPAVILSHGYNGTHDSYVEECRLFAENGYVAYVFDFCGGSAWSKSTGASTDMTIFTEKADLLAVFDGISALETVDSNQIFLLGGSQGGLISALAAEELGNRVKAMALYYPAYCIPDDWRNKYPDPSTAPETLNFWGLDLGREFVTSIHDFYVFDVIGSYENDILILQGDRDNIVPYAHTKQASEQYKSAKLVKVMGEGHGFSEKAAEVAREMVLEFLKEHTQK